MTWIEPITLEDIEQFADSLPPRKSAGTPNNSHCCAVAKIIVAKGGARPLVTYGTATYRSVVRTNDHISERVFAMDLDPEVKRFIRLFDRLKKKRASKADVKSVITRVRNEFRGDSVAVTE